MRRYLLPLMGVILLTGCAASKVEGLAFSAPDPVPPGKAVIYFYRPTDEVFTTTRLNFLIYIDGQEVGNLKYGGYLMQVVEPGNHQIASQYVQPTIIPIGLIEQGLEMALKHPSMLDVKLSPGQTAYLKVHGTDEFFYRMSNLSPVPDATAVTEIKQTNRMQ